MNGALHLLFILSSVVWLSDGRESLQLNYQDYAILERSLNTITIGVNYAGSCGIYRVEFFTYDDILMGPEATARSVRKFFANGSVSLSLFELRYNQSEMFYVRVVAENDQGVICSDDLSQQSFYRFLSIKSPGIIQHFFDEHGTVELPISDSQCNYVYVRWRRRPTLISSYCHCLTISGHFDECAEACGGDYHVRMNDNKIVFRNQGTREVLMVHFVCNEDPCQSMSCFMESIIASHTVNTVANLSEVTGEQISITSASRDLAQNSTIQNSILIAVVAPTVGIILLLLVIITIVVCASLPSYKLMMRKPNKVIPSSSHSITVFPHFQESSHTTTS